MSYTYDAVGNRLTQEKSMADGKETTRYSYNSLNQLTSSETSLNLQGVSGNIISTVRHEKEGDEYYHYHKDPAGSSTNLRDADGTSVVSYQYTDFGETTVYGDSGFYNEFCYYVNTWRGIFEPSENIYPCGIMKLSTIRVRDFIT